MDIKEGYIKFKEFKTYYRIVGEKYLNSKKKPLILLHGGPGSTHNYFEVLDKLSELDSRSIIMYDQIGCGNSYILGHEELFNKETWIEELINLRKELKLDEVHILGQSWGGMMCLIYALDYNPEGVKSYILSSTLPSAKLWEKEQHRRISYMKKEYQEAFKKAIELNDYSDPLYLEALEVFMNNHCNPRFNKEEEIPECISRVKKTGTLSYEVGRGKNEFTPTGTLSDFEVIDRLKEIKVPCLITDGQRDLCSPFIAKTMFDNIKNSKWELFEYSGHMPFVEENTKYINILIKWLNEND